MDISQFTISGQQERLTAAIHANQRLIRVRWYYAAILLLTISAVQVFVSQLYESAMLYATILAIVYIINGLLLSCTYWFKESLTMQRIVMALQIMLDLSVAVAVVYIQGGLEARTTLLFVTPIIAAGLIFPSRAVYAVALMTGLAYAGVVVAYEMLGDHIVDANALLVAIWTYPTILIVQAFLANHLAKADIVEAREQAYDSFLSMMAHQLRHPVSVSNTIIDVIDSSSDSLDPDLRRKISMLKGENEDLIRTISNLLEVAGGKHDQLVEELNIGEVIKNTATKASQAALRSDDLTLHLGASPLMVNGDKYKLSLLFTNLIDNAFRYSQEGSKVTVSLKGKSNDIVCEITDQGKGIDEEQIKAVLEPYNFKSHKKTVAPVNGFSLGIYVARHIAQEHRGDVTLHSETNGTKVVVELKGKA